MELKSIHVRYFRNIIDSGDVQIDEDVTCLVGKNESGKTALLQALHRLNPAHDGVTFTVSDHYPAWLEKRHRQGGKDLEAVRPITATLALEKEEVDSLEARFGVGCVRNPSGFEVSRTYGNGLAIGLEVSEDACVRHLLASIDWAHGTKTEANKVRTIGELRAYGESLKTREDNPEQAATGQSVLDALMEGLGGADSYGKAVWNQAKVFLPRFLYFSEYSTLPYTINIDRVLSVPSGELSESERTARSLLRIAAAEDDYLRNPDYERRKRELENVANAITTDVLKYWTQNPGLRVHPDITQRTVTDQSGQHSVLDELKIRVWDDRHFLSLPFSEHSTGFQWFFSFLAAFSEFEFTNEPLVLLLDEPALGLHARAQSDFLRFIDERLAPRRQVIYTTHSPFMVQPGELDRVRLVEDKGQELGAVVSADVTSTDPDTLFPLQGALGYDLVQHLFIAPHNLVVEGTSDFTYLRVLSDFLEGLGRSCLDPRWSVVPVGGVDMVPSFVALLGNHLDVTVLVDGKKGGYQRLNRMADAGLLSKKRIVTIGQIVGTTTADIEDLFSADDYLGIFNAAMNAAASTADLVGTEPIVRRLAHFLGVDRFDHGKPADYLLRNRDVVLPSLAEQTLDRFERLFLRVNETLQM